MGRRRVSVDCGGARGGKPVRLANNPLVGSLPHLHLGRLRVDGGRRRAWWPTSRRGGSKLLLWRRIRRQHAADSLDLGEGSLHARGKVGIHTWRAHDAASGGRLREDGKGGAWVRPNKQPRVESATCGAGSGRLRIRKCCLAYLNLSGRGIEGGDSCDDLSFKLGRLLFGLGEGRTRRCNRDQGASQGNLQGLRARELIAHPLNLNLQPRCHMAQQRVVDDLLWRRRACPTGF